MARSAVNLTKGKTAHFEKIVENGNVAKREFCLSRGTPLFGSSSAAGEHLEVRASTLDDPSWFRPEANVWVASAQPWDHFDPTISSSTGTDRRSSSRFLELARYPVLPLIEDVRKASGRS
jgi:hypothetical protein